MAPGGVINRQFVRFAGGLPTRVLTLGPSGLKDKPKKLILVIPGNPGQAIFYEDFMLKLYQEIDYNCSIWSLSHLGHDMPSDPELRSLIPHYQDNENALNLKAQIEHKINFVQEFIPEDCDLTVIGHSIGCKMALETMRHFKKNFPNRKAIQGYFLFPTIERMADTPSGKSMWPFLSYLRPLVVFLILIVQSIAPKALIRQIIRWHLGSQVSDSNLEAASNLANSEIVNNSLSLAHNELQTIKDLDLEALGEVIDQIKFYFGTIDNWCPIHYYEDLKKSELGDRLQAEVCNRKIEHAFVIKSSIEMAQIVAQWFIKN